MPPSQWFPVRTCRSHRVQVQGCRGEFGKSGEPGRTLCIRRYVSGVAILLVESGVGWNWWLWFCSMFQNILSTLCWKLFQVFREEYLRKRRYQIKQCPGSSLAPLTHTRFSINYQFSNHCFEKDRYGWSTPPVTCLKTQLFNQKLVQKQKFDSISSSILGHHQQ